MEKKKKTGKRKFWLIAAATALLVLGLVQVIRHVYRESEKEILSQLRQAVKKGFPEEAAKVYAAYGLERFGSSEPGEPGPGLHNPDVVLIHGLDDPGKVWMNLAPALVALGFRVWVMTYPNDQPIRESAQFFLEELQSLAQNQKGVESVSLVAHSMGGLVSREMLTHPDWNYPARVGAGEAPGVGRLIMVGTPNHGSDLARALAEIRDQLANLFSGNYHWLRWVLDGAGEAGIDLLPGSRFLETLNSRLHPPGVEMTVIAGVISPLQTEKIKGFIDKLQSGLPADSQAALAKLEEGLKSMANGIGDGLVTVDSARLEGIPLHIVEGTHLSIIRNIRSGSSRVPPSLPIIIKQL